MRTSVLSTLRCLTVLMGLASVTIISPISAYAQSDYPSRRIHVVVPYPAGGIVDIATRIMTDRLSKILGQPIIVEARPGANTNLGTEFVSRAAPDGYTWVYMGPATLANPHIYTSLRWSEKSFTGLGMMARAPFAIVVNPNSPANSVGEFVELAKKSPGSLNYGNIGIGSAVHMNAAMFMLHTKTELTMVPYTGQPQALIDLMTDRIHFMVASVGLVAEQVEAKKLKALAVIANQRLVTLPNVPTLTEAGYPEINVVPWYGLAVPVGVPAPIVEKINAAINTVLRDPEVKTLFEKQSLVAAEPMTSQQVATLIEKDAQEFGRVVKSANIKINP